MRISDTMSESKKQNRQVTVTPEKEHSRILSVSQVSESEWVCDLSGDHGNLDNCSEWNLFKICIHNFESDSFSDNFIVPTWSPSSPANLVSADWHTSIIWGRVIFPLPLGSGLSCWGLPFSEHSLHLAFSR